MATAPVAVNADINWKAGSLAGGAPVLQCFFAIGNHVRQHSRNRAVTVNFEPRADDLSSETVSVRSHSKDRW